MKRVATGGGDLHVEAFITQCGRDEVRDVGLIVHN
jgi:hypothetical protein